MIDLHCHILPNIDDGSSSWDESLEMIRMAYQDGIRAIVATPHWIEGTNWQPETSRVRDLVSELNTRIQGAGMDFKIYPGMEVGITAGLAGLIENDRILTLAEGDLLLLEVPFHSLPLGIESIISELESIGKRVVLAHPERNRELQKKPKNIMEYVKAGAMLQITAGSLAGDFGQNARRCALDFAKLGVIDFVSTDAHSVNYRKPIVSEGLRELEKAAGKEKAGLVEDSSYRAVSLIREP